jgi:hypothetical protein
MDDQNTQDESATDVEALQVWLKGKKGFDGGIVVQDGPNSWKINRNAKYPFDSSMKGWEVFDF